jgi:creatinine amidohydrolase
LVIVNGHGGNYVLQNVVQEANRTTPQMTLFPSPWDVRRARQTARLETNGTEDMHGGELEVSLLLHGAAHVVRPGYETLDTVADWSQLLITGMSGTGTPTGLIGRPSAASAEKGQALLDCYSALFADHLKLLSTD